MQNGLFFKNWFRLPSAGVDRLVCETVTSKAKCLFSHFNKKKKHFKMIALLTSFELKSSQFTH